MLTPKEFKTALKRLQYKSARAWNVRMVRRLFDECDKNRDGLLSIKEFSAYVQGVETSEAQARAESSALKAARPGSMRGLGDEAGHKGKGNNDNKLNLSDDEDDEVFRKNKVLTDHQLLRKVKFLCFRTVYCLLFDENQFIFSRARHTYIELQILFCRSTTL